MSWPPGAVRHDFVVFLNVGRRETAGFRAWPTAIDTRRNRGITYKNDSNVGHAGATAQTIGSRSWKELN
jgi:hypothetical protein